MNLLLTIIYLPYLTMINNFGNAIKSSDEQGLVLCVNGTCKPIIGNWVIIIVGATVMIFEVDGSKTDGSDHLSFQPFFIQVTMVEAKMAFVSLFKTMIAVANDFLGVEWFVARVIMDHSYPSDTAVSEVLKQKDGSVTEVIGCDVHIKRKVS
jgi:hypothetical protein